MGRSVTGYLSIIASVAVLACIIYAVNSGQVKRPPAVIGVYNVATGKPVIGVQVAYAREDGTPLVLGKTDVKGQLRVDERQPEMDRWLFVTGDFYEEVEEPGKAKPSTRVDYPVFVRYAKKPAAALSPSEES